MPSDIGERMRLVEQAIEDYIADTGKLPSTTDVIAKVDASAGAIRDDLDRLVQQGRITAAYEAPKNPTIYIPTYMYEAVLREQKEPSWMSYYTFKEAQKINEDIRVQEQQLTKLKRIESLLYATGRTLEEAVAAALQVLQMDDLESSYEDPDMWDVSFTHEDHIIIADIKGKSRWADKKDVAQLQQWLVKYVDEHTDVDPDRIRGLLIINHFKDEDPAERWPTDLSKAPISDMGARYLKLSDMRFVTCPDLFDLTRQVLQDQISEAEARILFSDRMHRGVEHEP